MPEQQDNMQQERRGVARTGFSLRAIASGELGDHAAQALEILAAAGSKPKELLRATSDIERMTRLFINKKKADEIGRRMRDIIEA